MTDTATALGRNISYYRKLSGLTQQQLADAIGLTRSSIANIEVGRQETSVTHLLDIARGLRIPAALLLPTEETETTADAERLRLRRVEADLTARITQAIAVLNGGHPTPEKGTL